MKELTNHAKTCLLCHLEQPQAGEIFSRFLLTRSSGQATAGRLEMTLRCFRNNVWTLYMKFKLISNFYGFINTLYIRK
jgi:hypothetical protein